MIAVGNSFLTLKVPYAGEAGREGDFSMSVSKGTFSYFVINIMSEIIFHEGKFYLRQQLFLGLLQQPCSSQSDMPPYWRVFWI